VRADFDALIIGGGPAGAAVAIRLAQSGWRVRVVEQHVYPRRKVCGESLAASGIELLDELGVGGAYRRAAGPELDQVGWMSDAATVVAPFPACRDGAYPYGRALGRESLDLILMERARAAGADVLQPARVRAVWGAPGHYECDVESDGRQGASERITSRVLVAAHGSWGPAPATGSPPFAPLSRAPVRASDLFAFKANYQHARLAPGLLSVIAFAGGYGGIVVADTGRTTLACCIRRDALAACRARFPGVSAGVAVENTLRQCCPGVREALADATREGAWLAVGPIRPGARLRERGAPVGAFRVGNAAGETHPLIGEGIAMALQSALLLTRGLAREAPGMIDAARARSLGAQYAAAWHDAFDGRMRLAALYAQVAMRPWLARPVRGALRRWPRLLTEAARRAGKARRALLPPPLHEEPA
jgi:2-polyprenyl-6-methoxyphenol hydroxylase-like FAD-dependent oxidoreductase